ncbi:MAG TPA: hypothetical protein VH593_29775 [Ktedonobacteraceae bacterium]|jgi:hypothetical protein
MSNFQIGLYLPPGAPDPYNIQSGINNPYLTSTASTILTWYSVPDARGVKFASPVSLGDDLGGFPAVRGYSQITWDYPYLRADGWYLLYSLWRTAQLSAGNKLAHVQIQWPDPVNGLIQAAARWKVITSVGRDMAVFRDIELVFTRLGVDDVSPPADVYRMG